jgi:hypothetical protein
VATVQGTVIMFGHYLARQNKSLKHENVRVTWNLWFLLQAGAILSGVTRSTRYRRLQGVHETDVLPMTERPGLKKLLFYNEHG